MSASSYHFEHSPAGVLRAWEAGFLRSESGIFCRVKGALPGLRAKKKLTSSVRSVTLGLPIDSRNVGRILKAAPKKLLTLVEFVLRFPAMFDAQVAEFPFVAGLPKGQKGKLARAWDLVNEIREIEKTNGQLIPLMLAAACLNVSRSRIDDFVNDGRLTRKEIQGHVFITEKSLIECAAFERKSGRPSKKPSAGDLWKASKEVAESFVKKVEKTR